MRSDLFATVIGVCHFFIIQRIVLPCYLLRITSCTRKQGANLSFALFFYYFWCSSSNVMLCPLPVSLFLGNVDQKYISTPRDVDRISSAQTAKCKNERLGKFWLHQTISSALRVEDSWIFSPWNRTPTWKMLELSIFPTGKSDRIWPLPVLCGCVCLLLEVLF